MGFPQRWPVSEKASGGTPATTSGSRFGVEAEKIRMHPHIRAVVAYEDGDVADDADAAGGTARAQRTPLLKKCKLQETADLELLAQLGANPIQLVRVAAGELARPAIPALALKAAA